MKLRLTGMIHNREALIKMLRARLCPIPRTHVCSMLNADTPIREGSVFYGTNGKTFKVIKLTKGGGAEVEFKEPNKTTRIEIAHRSNVKNGAVKNPYSASVVGIGYNGDLTSASDKDLLSFCREKWTSMLRRVKGDPSYKDVSVSESFKCLANFYSWAKRYELDYGKINRNWELDKDLLGDGKIYSEETCVFLPPELNRSLSKFSLVYKYHFRPIHGNFYMDYNDYMPLGSDTTYNILLRIHSEKLKNAKKWLRNTCETVRCMGNLPPLVLNKIDHLLNLEIDKLQVNKNVDEVNEVIQKSKHLKSVRYKLEFLDKFQGTKPTRVDSQKIRELLFLRDSPFETKGVSLTESHIFIKIANVCKRVPFKLLTDEFFMEQADKVFKTKLAKVSKSYKDIPDLENRLRKYLGYDDASLRKTLETIRNS